MNFSINSKGQIVSSAKAEELKVSYNINCGKNGTLKIVRVANDTEKTLFKGKADDFKFKEVKAEIMEKLPSKKAEEIWENIRLAIKWSLQATREGITTKPKSDAWEGAGLPREEKEEKPVKSEKPAKPGKKFERASKEPLDLDDEDDADEAPKGRSRKPVKAEIVEVDDEYLDDLQVVGEDEDEDDTDEKPKGRGRNKKTIKIELDDDEDDESSEDEDDDSSEDEDEPEDEDEDDESSEDEDYSAVFVLDKTTKSFKRFVAKEDSIFSGTIYLPKSFKGKKIKVTVE